MFIPFQSLLEYEVRDEERERGTRGSKKVDTNRDLDFFFFFFFSFEIIGIKKLRWSGNERLVETFERFILPFFLLAFSFSFSPSPEPSKPVKEDIAPLPNLPRYSHAASMDFTSAGYNVLKIFQNPVTKDYILNPCHSHPLLVAGYGRI